MRIFKSKRSAGPAILAIMFSLLISVVSSNAEESAVVAKKPILIIAHRGASKFAPQNTIPAIKKAIAMGLDYVEMDVRTTKDGEMVLMHNATVDGATTGTGAVRDLTLADIKKLDAGIRFRASFAGVTVPTFREALQVMKGKINAYIDFKDGDTKQLIDIINECGMADNVVLYVGLDKMLEAQKLDPRIAVMPGVDNAEQLKSLLKTIKFNVLETSVSTATKEFVDEAHANGIRVFMDILALADNKSGVKKALEMGVDAIQTDNPDVVLKYLEFRSKATEQ